MYICVNNNNNNNNAKYNMKKKLQSMIDKYFINPNKLIDIQSGKLWNCLEKDPSKMILGTLLLFTAYIIWNITYYVIPEIGVPIAFAFITTLLYRGSYNLYLITIESIKYFKSTRNI